MRYEVDGKVGSSKVGRGKGGKAVLRSLVCGSGSGCAQVCEARRGAAEVRIDDET